MGRHTKQGLDYFYLDVKLDDESELIEATHGHEGFVVLIKLFMKIYDNGYYLEWTDKQKILFAKKISVTQDKLQEILDDCIKWEIFDETLYKKHQIITSKRIQEHYIGAVYKRTNVKMAQQYLLADATSKKYIEITDIKNSISDDRNKDITGVSDDGNTTTTTVSDDRSTQSKVKESKEEKTSPSKRNFKYEEHHMKLAELLRRGVVENNKYPKDANLESWANDIRIMMDKGCAGKDIQDVILFTQKDPFWKTNIQSASKLKDQFSRLHTEMVTKKGQSQEKLAGNSGKLVYFKPDTDMHEYLKDG